MIKIAILYICTGKYNIFWQEFYSSAEKYLLNSSEYEKHYFVFTDIKHIEFQNSPNVHKIYQKQLPWPYITLDRFKIFQQVRHALEKMDYIYFFNANVLFVDTIAEDILPSDEKPLVLVQHPGFYYKNRAAFTYDQNKHSLAYITSAEGEHYFMGGVNGGRADTYLSLIEEIEKHIEIDKSKNIIALWHDESHLNRYAVDHQNQIEILNPSYGYPEGSELPFEPKIIIRDKNRHGGHDYLRSKESTFKKIYRCLTK